jgi:hypothetical protein
MKPSANNLGLNVILNSEVLVHIKLTRIVFTRAVALILFSLPLLLSAQHTVVRGKVTDANSGDPIPFANVLYLNTSIGATTDFDGNFELTTNTPTDTLLVSYVGYKPRKKAIAKGKVQTLNFQLEEDVTSLAEIVVTPGENPAFEILRKVVKQKDKHDKRRLTAYEYDTYTKIEIDVDNISEKFREKKVMKKITQVLDSIDRIAGEDGKPILPLFISESVSKYYYRDSPQLKYENILKSKVNGVGIQDGTLVTQLVGASFQEYNFYQNWLNILGKEFVSPIADGWRIYYDYDLVDSVYIGDDYCYRLDFFPRSPQDLAFTGTIWITKEGSALKQIDATVGKQANLNFIEKIKIQQELAPTEEGAWLAVKNRVLIDVSELTNASAGMLAKFYTSNKNVVVNKPHEPSFYDHPIKMAEDARLNEEEEYWDQLRHEPLSDTEKNVYRMIDTLQNIPVVKTYTDIVKIVVNGYYDAGKIYIGPYAAMIAYNNIEGLRIQPGFKTSMKFSNKWILRGQLGYGFGDEKFKYMGKVEHILSRERWTTVSIRARSDIGRLGIDEEALSDNYLFLAAQRWGTFRRGFYFDEGRFNFQRELFRGFTQRIAVRHMRFRPTFPFGYYNEEDLETAAPLPTGVNFATSELIVESRLARDELFIQDDNDRLSLGTTKSPIITVRYTRGFSGVAGSDFDYTKLRLSLYKRIRFGPLGVGSFNLTGEYVFDPVPYPLLTPHLGNQTPVFTSVTYNLMDFGEFVSDRYASLQYQHHFEGLLLNRIPLMRKLKWRLVGTANIIYGGLSDMNRKLIPTVSPTGETLPEVGQLKKGLPYMELGYGVENIFKFLRVDFIHRLSYVKDNPDARNFGVFFSAQFSL